MECTNYPALPLREAPAAGIAPIWQEGVAMPGIAEPFVDVETGHDEQLQREPQWVVFIHNDDVTPFEYVIRLLEGVFLLSEEIADHVATTAHTEGRAVVIIRPRDEAKRLINVAHSRARMDGYPLAFSMEPEK